MKRTLVTLTLSATLLAAAFAATAAPRGPRADRTPGMRGPGAFGIFHQLGRIKSELGLTDAQVSQLTAIFSDLRTKNEPYREELRRDPEVIDDLIENPSQLGAARESLERRAAAQKAMRLNGLEATARALQVLNADQRARLQDMLEERRERRKTRRSRR